MNPTIVIEQELGKSIRIVEGLGPGVEGRYEVNADGTSIVIDDDGIVSTAYSVVFIDAENPADATIFSDHLTPAVANPKLKDKPYKIYRTPAGTAFVYDIDPGTNVGSYIRLGQASISEWHVKGVTNTFTLPTVPPNNRIALHVNGVLYSNDVYTLTGTLVEWSGSFDIATYDTVSVFFF